MNHPDDNRAAAVPVAGISFGKTIINGVEIKRCKGGPHDCKPHVHPELSVGYILRGSTELTLNNRTLRYAAGDGVIIPPMVTHRCAPHDINRWEYVMLFIPPDYYADAVRFHQPKKLTGTEAAELLHCIGRLLAETNPADAEAALPELLLRFGDAEPEEEDAGTEAIRRVHAYLTDHVYDTVTLDQLQNLSGLNKFTLIRQFKKQYVATPAAYHLQCRVAEAKRLLGLHRDVFTVCDALHFYDQAHLIRELKKMYGVTPAAYQQQLEP